MKKLVIVLLLLIVAAGGLAYVLYRRVYSPFRGYQGVEQFVYIPAGVGSSEIGRRLVAGGIIPDVFTYRAALWLTGDGRRLKAGEYRFDRPMTSVEAITKIARGDVFVVTITFPEGLTWAEMAPLLASHPMAADTSAFLAAAKDAAPIRAFDRAGTDLEGYLFPDTYLLPRSTDAAKLVRLMVSRFEQAFAPDLRAAAEAIGLSVRQAVTLASIVEKETGKADERAIVAAVYRNRLHLGMLLQSDPTVIYALRKVGRYTGNLRREDLQFDSLYNTYRYSGLPPGPIASPGRASLEAAVHPAEVDYLYFVSRNDGSHAFARTLDEHNRNVQQYQRSGGSGRSGRSGGLGRPGESGGPGKSGQSERAGGQRRPG